MAHGTLVAELACANHTDFPFKGILPNCNIYALMAKKGASRKNSNLVPVKNGVEQVYIHSKFSNSILEPLDKMMDEAPKNMPALVVSLGTNWIKHADAQIMDSETKSIIKNLAPFFRRTYSELSKQNMVIFASAGNDSGAHIQDAKYNSALHYYADLQWKHGKRNIVIVEANDANGSRLLESNVSGHISCPSPVIIKNAVRLEKFRELPLQLQNNSVRGTSLSTPLCAGAYALLATSRPKSKPVELINCLKESGIRSSSGTMIINLIDASERCPKRIWK